MNVEFGRKVRQRALTRVVVVSLVESRINNLPLSFREKRVEVASVRFDQRDLVGDVARLQFGPEGGELGSGRNQFARKPPTLQGERKGGTTPDSAIAPWTAGSGVSTSNRTR